MDVDARCRADAAAFGSHWRQRGQVSDSLKLVLQRLAWVRSEHNAGDASRLEICDAHGLFTNRSCSLHAAVAGEPEAVSIQITLHVSRALRLLQALRRLSLSPRQSEIGFWLARGLSEPEIAQRTKLSLHCGLSPAPVARPTGDAEPQGAPGAIAGRASRRPVMMLHSDGGGLGPAKLHDFPSLELFVARTGLCIF